MRGRCVLFAWWMATVLSLVAHTEAQNFAFRDARGDVFVQPPKGLADTTSFDLVSVFVETATSAPLNTVVTFEMSSVTASRSMACGFEGPLIVLLWHQMAGGSWRVVKVGSQDPPLNSNVVLDPQFTWQLMV